MSTDSHPFTDIRGAPGKGFRAASSRRNPHPSLMCHQSALSCSPSNPRGHTPTHSTRELLSVSILTSNFPSKQLRNPWVCAAPTHNQMLISRQTNTCLLGAPCLLGEETFINHFPSSCVLAARGKSREQRRDKGLTWVERQRRWCVESPGNHPVHSAGVHTETATPTGAPVPAPAWAPGAPAVQERAPPGLGVHWESRSFTKSLHAHGHLEFS